jgi:putative transposase
VIEQAYKIELDLTNKQRTALLRHTGAARFAYNWGLDQWKKMYEAGEKPDTMKLHKALNALKAEKFSWMYQVSKCAMQEALIDLGKAYKRLFMKKGGCLRFKSRYRSKMSFRLTSPSSMKVTSKTIKLPVIGTIRLKERDYIPTDAIIKQATVCEKAGKWFVVIMTEQEIKPVAVTGEIIGIDLGVKTLATCSDGSAYDNAKYLKASMKKLKGLSKKLARQKKGSKR